MMQRFSNADRNIGFGVGAGRRISLSGFLLQGRGQLDPGMRTFHTGNRVPDPVKAEIGR
jgi:hypothetical protein